MLKIGETSDDILKGGEREFSNELNLPSHETSPCLRSEAKGVMYNEFPVRSCLFHNQISFPVELFQFIKGGKPPGFIDWFKAKNSGVIFVHINNDLDHIKSALDLLVVYGIVTVCFSVEFSHPSGCLDRPVFKCD